MISGTRIIAGTPGHWHRSESRQWRPGRPESDRAPAVAARRRAGPVTRRLRPARAAAWPSGYQPEPGYGASDSVTCHARRLPRAAGARPGRASLTGPLGGTRQAAAVPRSLTRSRLGPRPAGPAAPARPEHRIQAAAADSDFLTSTFVTSHAGPTARVNQVYSRGSIRMMSKSASGCVGIIDKAAKHGAPQRRRRRSSFQLGRKSTEFRPLAPGPIHGPSDPVTARVARPARGV
jgi:hypothetical protein